MTDIKHAAGMICLVDLTDPPPAPTVIDGIRKGGWVDLDGSSLQVGSVHGNPGLLIYLRAPLSGSAGRRWYRNVWLLAIGADAEGRRREV